MMNKKSLIVMLCLLASTAHAETLIYRGSAYQKRFEEKDANGLNSLNFRGENAEREYQQRYSLPNVQGSVDVNDKNILGNYSLSNIGGVQSMLSINKDGTFSWFMQYKKTVLETNGNWNYLDQDNNIISLTTDPMPGDIGFNFLKTNDVGARLPSLMAMGSYEFQVDYAPKSKFDKNGPLKGVEITCAGPYGVVHTTTNDKGFALCNRAGYPLKFLKMKAPGIQNETTFQNPKFDGFSWNFTMDYERAHTGYAFYKERMQLQNGVMLWDGSSLGANQTWKYIK